MTDPLAEIVTLLQPSASFSKLVEYAGRWRIRPDVQRKPVYFAVLEGECRISSEGHAPISVRAGDFVLLPASSDQVIESIDAPPHGVAMTPIELEPSGFGSGTLVKPSICACRSAYAASPPPMRHCSYRCCR